MLDIYAGLSLELGAYNESSRELAIVVMYYRWYLPMQMWLLQNNRDVDDDEFRFDNESTVNGMTHAICSTILMWPNVLVHSTVRIFLTKSRSKWNCPYIFIL